MPHAPFGFFQASAFTEANSEWLSIWIIPFLLISAELSTLFLPRSASAHGQAAVASLLGLLAKEEIVGVFGVLYNNLNEAFTSLSGYSFLMFNLLCAPCVAAMSAIRKEMNDWKWTAFAISYQCLFAYCASLCFYQLGLLFTTGVMSVSTIFAFAVIAVFTFMLVRKKR